MVDLIVLYVVRTEQAGDSQWSEFHVVIDLLQILMKGKIVQIHR